jgi:hypothetical protein
MALLWLRPPIVAKMHGVAISEEHGESSGQATVRRTFSTPLGSVHLDERREPGTGQWHGQRSWNDVTPWRAEYPIKEPGDYEVVKYIFENTEYVADYFPIEQAIDWLGDEGVVIDYLPYSPMQTLMIEWIGMIDGRFFVHLADHQDLVEDLCETIRKCRAPVYEISARSPAPIAQCGDNVDGVLATPPIFEKYFMPEYEKQAEVLHRHGKLMAVHMDGRLAGLKELIARTPIDIIEAFHPPPMGDLTVSDALDAWQDKSIWVAFPSSVYFHGPEVTRQFALELLGDLQTGERVVIEMSTENLVSNENLLALTKVLENVQLPITKEQLDRRRSLCWANRAL